MFEDDYEEPAGMSTGAKIAIVFLLLLLVGGGIAALVFAFGKKETSPATPMPGKTDSGTGSGSGSESGSSGSSGKMTGMGDQWNFAPWHVWMDNASFNFVCHLNGKVLRIWADKNVTSETWPNGKMAQTNDPYNHHFYAWSIGCNKDTFIIQNRKFGNRFTLTANDNDVTIVPGQDQPQHYNENFPVGIDFSGGWKVETDELEMRIVHKASNNTFRMNKNGYGFNVAAAK